tara:strand:- start:697 stop:1341 length:645 start_codon:yes stop_codon:yes gene_type:complete
MIDLKPEKLVEYVHSSPHAEKLIVEMARVSNPKNAKNWGTGPKLLQYLMKEKHWSPWEMCNLCLKINTTRDVSAQIIRHRTFSFQEYSQRYAVTPRAEIPALRRQDTKNRQNSIDNLNEFLVQELEMKIGTQISATYELYEYLLESGVAKECARRILPMSSPTVLYMNGTLRSWIHYLWLRTDESTQLEHRMVAEEAKEIFKVMFPIVSEAAEL